MKKEELRELIKEFEATTLSKLTIEEKDFKVSLEKNTNSLSEKMVVKNETVESNVNSSKENTMKSINAPLVGTFYLTRSPGGKPIVAIGQQVKVGDVIGIIEAMKVMNEIQADQAGIVKAILAPTGKLVEYNQPLIELE